MSLTWPERAKVRFTHSSVGVAIVFVAFSYVTYIWPLSMGAVDGATVANDVTPAAAAEGLSQPNFVNQAIWIVLAGATGAFILRQLDAGRRIRFSSTVIFLITFLVLAGLSSRWAIAPDISTRRFVQQCLIVSVFFLLPAFVQDKVRVLNAVYFTLSITIGLNILLFPVIGIGPLGYAGFFPQKNLLGAVAALALIFSIFNFFAPKATYRLVSAFIGLGSAGLLVVSQSKTSLGLAVICPALACAVVFSSRAANIAYLLALMFWLLVAGSLGILVTQVLAMSQSDVSMLLFNDTTFTGRTTIWAFSSSMVDQRPWLGWGYQSFWGIGLDAPNLKLDSFVVGLNQSHNGYLDIMLETGYVGFSIIVLYLLSIFTAIDRTWRDRPDVSLLLISTILFCVVHNLLESSMTRTFSPVWTFVLMVAGVSATLTSKRSG